MKVQNYSNLHYSSHTCSCLAMFIRGFTPVRNPSSEKELEATRELRICRQAS